MIKPIISVIVPVYNAEQVIARCINSLLAQTFSEIELILVNDGSTDKSGDICDEYKIKDNRVTVVHLTNGGVSHARNTGISLAQGDYLMFCDSDDYVEINWCSELYDAIKREGNVLPVSGVRFVYTMGGNNKEVIRAFHHTETISKRNYFELYKKGVSGYVWCKLYDRRIIVENSLYFDVNVNRAEDLLFNLSYIPYTNGIVTIPTVTYNYVHANENSLFNSYRKNLSDINVMVYDAWKQYFKLVGEEQEQTEEFATYFYLNYLNMLTNTFDKRNKDSLIKKLRYNNGILNSKEFKECLALADTSKEDPRYIKLLKTNNYYLVWLAEQMLKLKNYFSKKAPIN